MNAADIRAWLASAQDFAQGVALYAQLGTSPALKRLFALEATPHSRGVLLRELRALGAEPPPAAAPTSGPGPPPVPTPTTTPSTPGPAAAPAAEPAPAVAAPPASAATEALLAGLAGQLKAVRDERSHLHPQLTGKNVGKKARGEIALRIVAVTAEEGQLKAQLAHVQLHGRLPGPVASAEVTDAGELRQRLANRRSQRSKLRLQPDKAAKLAEVEAEILLIVTKLAA